MTTAEIKPVLSLKEYVFTNGEITVILEIDVQRKIYSVRIKDIGIESAFIGTDGFDNNIVTAELILKAVKFAKDEMKGELL